LPSAYAVGSEGLRERYGRNGQETQAALRGRCMGGDRAAIGGLIDAPGLRHSTDNLGPEARRTHVAL